MQTPRVDNIISRQTSTSGRALLAFGASVVFAKAQGVQLANFEPFQQILLKPEALETAAIGLLWFLLFSHVTHWYNDWIASSELRRLFTAYSTARNTATSKKKYLETGEFNVHDPGQPTPKDLRDAIKATTKQKWLFIRQLTGRVALIVIKDLVLPLPAGVFGLAVSYGLFDLSSVSGK